MVRLNTRLRSLVAFVLLAALQMVPFEGICIEKDGVHANISSAHACCESEAVSACSTADDCLDLAFNADISFFSNAIKLTAPHLVLAYIIPASLDRASFNHISSALVRSDAPPSTLPIHSLRYIEILV